MDSIQFYNADSSIFATIKPDTNSVQKKVVMGENALTITFSDSKYLPFVIGHYCYAFEEKYILNTPPTITKNGTSGKDAYVYALQLQAEGFDLNNVQYCTLDASNQLTNPIFSLTGTALFFLQLLQQNTARLAVPFQLGQVIPTGVKTISFNGESCLSALIKIANAFETEYWLDGRTVHLTKRQRDTGWLFKQGRNLGLYNLTRQAVNDSSVVTRLYVLGGNKNLPYGYSNFSDRLRLPPISTTPLSTVSNVTVFVKDSVNAGNSTYTFSWTPPLNASAVTIEYRLQGATNWNLSTGNYIAPRTMELPAGTYEFRFTTNTTAGTTVTTDPTLVLGSIIVPLFPSSTPTPYLENNVAKYGVREATMIFDDIYPHRTGKVTSVNAVNFLQFVDTTMDFDINQSLMPGMSAKVNFLSGQLAGYTFEIAKYDPDRFEFTILKNKDEKALDIPSELLRPAIGDEYVLIDIYQPTKYVSDAENELLQAATIKLKGNTLVTGISEPQLAYTLELDPTYVKRYNRIPKIGYLITVQDTELEVNRRIRVVSTTRYLVEENKLKVDVSDVLPSGTIERLTGVGTTNSQNIDSINNQLGNNNFLSNKIVGDLPTISDTTGFFPLYVDGNGKLYKKV